MEFFHQSLAFIEGVGGPELLLVFFIALLLFGGDKLPALARTLGKSLNELKKASGDVEKEIKRALEEEPAKPSRPVVPAVPAPSQDSDSAFPPLPSSPLQNSPPSPEIPEKEKPASDQKLK